MYLTWAKAKTRMWLGDHSICQRCSQLLSECLMDFPGHKSHHNCAGIGEDIINITATSLTEVVGCQERIIPAAEVVGQNSSKDICRRFLACSVASVMSSYFMTLWTVTCQAPLFMGFSRQEYCIRSSFPSPGNLPNPRIEPKSLVSPALAGGFFTTSATLEALNIVHVEVI